MSAVERESKGSNRVIYRIGCETSGRCYIGTTINPDRRRAFHFSCLRTGKHCNSIMQADFARYGESSFSFEVLCHVRGSEALRLEREYISYYSGNGGTYNTRSNGRNRDLRLWPCSASVSINGTECVGLSTIASRVGVSRQCIYNWMRETPPIPKLTVDNKMLFPLEAVEAWLESRGVLQANANALQSKGRRP